MMVPFLNLLLPLGIFRSMAEQLNLSVLNYEVTQCNATGTGSLEKKLYTWHFFNFSGNKHARKLEHNSLERWDP